jgi:hypothetical protein
MRVNIASWVGTMMFGLMATACNGIGGPIAVPSPDPGEQPGQEVVITGTLTEEGVECPAMRDDRNRLYTLTGDAGGFPPGTRLRVRGTVAEVSFCMQGTTIEVSQIERL